MKTLLVVTLSMLTGLMALANKPPITISGKVENSDGNLPYATVSIKGTTIGTVTDQQGRFTLNHLSSDPAVLRIQAVGYKTQEVTIDAGGTAKPIVIQLKEDLIGLSEVVVTANRYEVNRQEAPVIVNVLRAGLLESTHAVCLADGLGFQPGIRIENNCQNCGFQQVRINGLEGPYSQILIDSRPIFSALSGVYGIEQIPVAMIEKVEIVRGGGSALYGSNAIAGTINIITKEPTTNSFNAAYNHALIAGEAADRSLSLNGTFVTEDRKAGISMFAAQRSRDQYDANNDGFSELGIINGKAMGMRTFYKTSDYSKLNLTYHYVSEFRRGGNLFDLQPHETDITEQTDHEIHGGEIHFHQFSKNLMGKWSVYTSAQHIDRKSYYGAQQDMNAYGRTYDLSFVAGSQFNHKFENMLFAPAQLTTGIEYQINQLEDNMPGYNRSLEQDINIAGFFLQNQWKLNRTTINLGGRIDQHNLIDNIIFSPRVSVLFDITPQLQWRSNYSTGFRAPQAFDEDLHIIAVNGGVMLIELDPELRPEYSNSISTSLDSYYSISGKANNLMVEGFYTRLNDVFVLETLETDDMGNMRVERRNGTGAVVKGINIENRTVFSNKLELQMGFTFQKSLYDEPEEWSDDPDTDLLETLPRSPDTYGFFNISYSPAKQFKTHMNGIYTGSMKVPHFEGFIENDRIENTPAFMDIGIKLSYDFQMTSGFTLRLEAGVQNILNSYQTDFDEGVFRDAGYIYGPMKPRTIFVGLKIGNTL